MARKFIPYNISALIFLTIFCASCKKLQENPIPIAVWEDKGPDSVTLRVNVQTQDGIFMIGSYVNLALNQDSLNNGLLIRRASTDATGRARFNRLYPRKYYSNCFAYYQSQSLYGSFRIQLPPYAIRDTILIVH